MKMGKTCEVFKGPGLVRRLRRLRKLKIDKEERKVRVGKAVYISSWRPRRMTSPNVGTELRPISDNDCCLSSVPFNIHF